MDAQIQVWGDDEVTERASLWRWMRDDDHLRGHLGHIDRPISATELGGATELLTVALGSGGVAMALARVLTVWLQTRRSDVRVSVTVGKRHVELEASNVDAALPLLRQVLVPAEEP